jgi:hypothetical protein
MTENLIEDYLVWVVELNGGKTWKFVSPSNRGVADRIVCLPDGQTWFVELKRPKGGKVSALQKRFADDMVELNQRYALLWDREMIDEWAKAAGLPGRGR